jgi:oligoendopeptidase F
VFDSVEAFEAELKSIAEAIPSAAGFKGRLHEGPQVLLQAYKTNEALIRRVGKAFVYAMMERAVDTTDQAATMRAGQAMSLFGQVIAAVSFLDPELKEIGQETLNRWLDETAELKVYRHYVDNLFRMEKHIRSAEVEELLGMLVDNFAQPRSTYTMLTNADFKFPPARTADGKEIAINEGVLDTILGEDDREARRTAWEGYTDTFLAYKNTLASNLTTSIKQNVFNMRARRFPTTLDMALDANNIPPKVFYNLLDTFKANLPTWQRYWAVRRKALGVDTLHPYDIWAPIAKIQPVIPYEQAVDWICRGLAPMGEEYVSILRRGCLEQRWVDVFGNAGKTSGAFSAGFQGTYPFIMMSYDNTLSSLSTLAHELGHSMHSYLTWQNQPLIYTDYSMFVAEVASNFHQAMVRASLLKENNDPNFQIALIEEAMSNFHRYFFIMPTLERFELDMHQRVEKGQGLNADEMNECMAELFEEAYGGEMYVDRPRVGITWATFGHLFIDYYVFQYATGISAAHALSNRILSGEKGAVQDYLNFLKAGASVYPIDALKIAGVDMTKPEPVEATFKILADMVDRLDKLVS